MFGRDLAEPLQARAYDGPVAAEGGLGLRVTPAERVLAEVRPMPDGSVRVRLRNVGADPVAAEVGWDGPGRVAGGGRVPLGPHGVGEVLLRREG